MEIKTIGVLGAGAMGHGIAVVAASKGYDVILYDVNQQALDRAAKMIRISLKLSVKSSSITSEQVEPIISRIKHTLNFQELSSVDFFIEAAPEDLELKKKLLMQIDTIDQEHAIFATNTSQFSISDIASSSKRPDKVVGMHWFNPPQIMKLIEMVRGHLTSDQTIDITSKLAENLGKTVVICDDSPGFITSRALAAFVIECVRMYEEGVASMRDIDKAIKLGLNHPKGPFELSDFIGLDVLLKVALEMTRHYGDRFLPPRIIKNLVNSGHLGKKTGKGYYNYT
jgi:3-hydroxybutyryl-CoA dehydrogenase